MKKKLPFFPLYTSDFVADTQDLTNEEIGAYFRILMYSWGKGKFKLDRIKWICQDDEIWSALKQYFTEEKGLWFNPRMERERQKALDRYDKMSERGKAGADARWNPTSNASSNATSIPQAMPETIATHNSEPITHNTKQITHKERYAPHAIFADINDGKIQSYEKGQITKLCQEYSQELVISTIEKMGDAKWHSIKSLKGLLDGSIKIERGAKEGAISTIA